MKRILAIATPARSLVAQLEQSIEEIKRREVHAELESRPDAVRVGLTEKGWEAVSRG